MFGWSQTQIKIEWKKRKNTKGQVSLFALVSLFCELSKKGVVTSEEVKAEREGDNTEKKKKEKQSTGK